jgi:hypothetical protein
MPCAALFPTPVKDGAAKNCPRLHNFLCFSFSLSPITRSGPLGDLREASFFSNGAPERRSLQDKGLQLSAWFKFSFLAFLSPVDDEIASSGTVLAILVFRDFIKFRHLRDT